MSIAWRNISTRSGVTNYLIDLSGKLRARGRNAHGTAWQVAIEQPAPDDPSGAAGTIPAVVALRDESIATAGDYRRFFESGGRHYSHIIDPRTGAPVAHATLSATALGPTCMQADALATLLMVMEPAAALRVAAEQGRAGAAHSARSQWFSPRAQRQLARSVVCRRAPARRRVHD